MEVKLHSEKTPISTVLTAVAGAAVALLPAITQLFSSERRYEVLFLSAAAFMGVIVWYQNKRAIEGLRQLLDDMKHEHESCRTDITKLQHASAARAGHLNATIINLYRDLVRISGRRSVGTLSFQEDTETYHYEATVIKAPRKTGDRRRK